jgi:hypothetical protein
MGISAVEKSVFNRIPSERKEPSNEFNPFEILSLSTAKEEFSYFKE